MSQKYIKSKNNNTKSAAYGKYYAKAVYDGKFVETDEIADFIQTQATLKRSDIKAALDELGSALKHFLGMGQKIRLKGIGIFKVGFSSIGVAKIEDCGAQTITTRRVLFQPETSRVIVGQKKLLNGSVKQKYVNAIGMLKDVAFEETHENTTSPQPSPSGEGASQTGSENGSQGGNQGGSENQGGNGGGTTNPPSGGGNEND